MRTHLNQHAFGRRSDSPSQLGRAVSAACALLLGACVDYEVCTTHYALKPDAGEPWSVRYLLEERPHRPWVAWHENARPALESFYQKGQRNGIWKTYNEEGQLLFERSYLEDEPSGEWKRYWPDGKPYETGRFERGLKVGVWKRYGIGGSLLEEASYYEGVYQGERRLFDMDGKLISTENYLSGKLR